MAFVGGGLCASGKVYAGATGSAFSGSNACLVASRKNEGRVVVRNGSGVQYGNSSLQMNLFERFSRVARSTANSILNKVENPEKILEQSMIDMQADLVKVRQAYAEVSATLKRLERQQEEARAKELEWYKRAQLALERGQEELAREALVRKTSAEENANALGTQVLNMRANAEKLADSLVQIEQKITEAKAIKDELVARARTAKTRTQVNEMLNSVSTSSGLASFERMREKVEKLEAESEVSDQFLPGAASPSLEGRFKELEAGSAVDRQLAAMKAQLPGSSSASTSSSSSSSPPSSASKTAQDYEIEKMKREMNM
eukprot:CAMPEP_0182443344 /NCGR_PEP_ID=MMETSP1172-20130603/2107_1 /TAXON_ID=708627 /ORGANISM="Timspurckia oligopyrenoides, Strain CCMP3278" /LENGTH=315 /DNA_ID=CAMNT_0024638601 /DNA_START=58 /DNA_END=1005 /DNA_ORIENTATION=-